MQIAISTAGSAFRSDWGPVRIVPVRCSIMLECAEICPTQGQRKSVRSITVAIKK
jgi:hypothetical protein